MTVYTVTNVSQFNAAITSATGGDRIELAASSGFDNISISGKAFTGGGITIASASGYEAVLNVIGVANSSGITFENVTFHRTLSEGEPGHLNAGSFTNCSDITINNCAVNSSVDNNFLNDCDGLEFSGITNLTVTNTEFTDVRKGLIVYNSDNVNASYNSIHHLGGDALNFVNIRNSEIVGNVAYDWGAIGDFHRDFIQFWTNTSHAPTEDVEIRGNVLIAPDTAIQGIYIDSDNDQSFYDVRITENLIITQAPNAITLWPAQDSEISNNTVIGGFGNNSAGMISVANEPSHPTNIANNITISDNISNGVLVGAGTTNITTSGNYTAQFTAPQGANYSGNLFLDAIHATSVNDLRPTPGGGLPSGIGATEPYATAPAPVAYIAASLSSAPTSVLTPSFSAVDWDGIVPAGTTYAWDFGDGVTAEGANVSHRFAGLGEHTVSLTTTTPGVGSVTENKTILVTHPVVLDVRFDNDPASSNGASTAVTDLSPYARTGTWMSGTSATADPNADIYVTGSSGSGSAASFDNQTSIVSFNNANEFNGQSKLTFALDLNADAIGNDRILWKAGVFGLEMQGSGKLKVYVYTQGAGEQTLLTNAAISTDAWHSVVVTYDGGANPTAGTGAVTIYIDGVAQGTLGGLGPVMAWTSNPLTIGGGSGTRYFDGDIDNVRIYAGAYTPSDVAALDAYLANTAPTEINLGGDGVFERAVAGTVVGTLSTVDPGDTATYALAPDSNPLFALSGSNLVVASGASLDYETATNHQVTIRATDSAGNVHQETITVQIKDALEFPTGGGDLTGTPGADMVYGGPGNDHFYAGAGADTFLAGGGFDVADYSGSAAPIIVDITNPLAGSGDAAGDVFDLVERIIGTDYADSVAGSSGGNNLMGQSGNDTLDGRDGNDALYGGPGNDLLIGGSGADQMQGSSGDDTYLFRPGEAPGDEITNFAGNGSAAGDMLRFEGYGAGATLTNVGDMWTVTWSGGAETFQIIGITALDPSDYLFS